MRENIYAEYKNVYANLNANQEDEQSIQTIISAIHSVLQSSNLARKEGLLALEEYAMELDSSEVLVRFYREILMLIIDGTAPENVEEVGLYKLISYDLQGMRKLAGIMYLLGALKIQGGENPRFIEECLYSMVPIQWLELVKKSKEQGETSFKDEAMSLEGILADIEGKESPITPDQDGYFVVRLNEQIIENMDDLSVQRILRDVENSDLTMAMKGMEGAAICKLLKNLSERLAIMVVADMRCLGSVQMRDVARANQKILYLMLKLMRTSEISKGPYDFLKGFAQNVEVDFDKAESMSSQKLRRLLEEYESVIHGTI